LDVVLACDRWSLFAGRCLLAQSRIAGCLAHHTTANGKQRSAISERCDTMPGQIIKRDSVE
jgi:hypothetical protein